MRSGSADDGLATRPLGSADRLSTVDQQRLAGEVAREWREQECDVAATSSASATRPSGMLESSARSTSCSAPADLASAVSRCSYGESSPGLGSRC